MDLLGIVIISFISAFGGGVVRDLLVDRTPFIFTESYPLFISLSIIVISLFLKINSVQKLEDSKVFVLSDTIGLAVFAYSGALIGIEYDFNFMGIVFLGLLTATGGGLIRDVVMSKSPFLLSEGFYGTVAIIIGILTYLVPMYSIMIISTGILIRIVAIRYGWRLPIKKY